MVSMHAGEGLPHAPLSFTALSSRYGPADLARPTWPPAAERRDRAGAAARWAAAGRLRDAGAGDDAQSSDQPDHELCGQLPTVSRRELSEPRGLHRGLPAEGVRADLPPGRPEIGPTWLDEFSPPDDATGDEAMGVYSERFFDPTPCGVSPEGYLALMESLRTLV